MKKTTKRTGQVRAFLIRAIADERKDFVISAVRRFGITRQAVNSHLRQLVSSGYLGATGRTRRRSYVLPKLDEVIFSVAIVPGVAEHRVWQERVASSLSSIPENVLDICHYGFTEMVNNAIDHSGGSNIMVTVIRTAAMVEIDVSDDGIGVFRKIKEGLGLADERESILELAKGKVTTDPERHSGEGIFFSSRLFDEYCMLSGKLLFRHDDPGDDWLTEARAIDPGGTMVQMRIAPWSSRTMRQVFDRYAPEKEDYGFSKTHVPVSLMQTGQENLVSRSQAKRLLSRFNKFREVMLDFHGVSSIGQAFADEIFRVFKAQNPGVSIAWAHANREVEQMIQRAIGASDPQKQQSPDPPK